MLYSASKWMVMHRGSQQPHIQPHQHKHDPLLVHNNIHTVCQMHLNAICVRCRFQRCNYRRSIVICLAIVIIFVSQKIVHPINRCKYKEHQRCAFHVLVATLKHKHQAPLEAVCHCHLYHRRVRAYFLVRDCNSNINRKLRHHQQPHRHQRLIHHRHHRPIDRHQPELPLFGQAHQIVQL